MCTPATPPRMNSRTVRIVWIGSPQPAPASATSGMPVFSAISRAGATCSFIVRSGSVTAVEAPVT